MFGDRLMIRRYKLGGMTFEIRRPRVLPDGSSDLALLVYEARKIYLIHGLDPDVAESILFHENTELLNRHYDIDFDTVFGGQKEMVVSTISSGHFELHRQLTEDLRKEVAQLKAQILSLNPTGQGRKREEEQEE